MSLKFTKTQQKILDVLLDGQPHRRQELWACVPAVQGMTPEDQKEFGRLQANRHLIAIREKIRDLGQDIVCVVVKRQMCYRLVRTVQQQDIEALSATNE